MNENKDVLRRLNEFSFVSPPFAHNTNIFPYSHLGASLASWAVNTAVTSMNGFYASLGTPSPLANLEKQLEVPKPIKT